MSRTFGGSGYGWTGENPRQLREVLIKANNAFVKLQKRLKFDAIAFTGSSGAAIAFPLAVSHKIPLIYVRKEGEQSHGDKVECNGENSITKYLIVDDFVSSGATVEWIAHQVKRYAKGSIKPELVGIFCFSNTQGDHKIPVDGKNIQIYTTKSRLG